LDAALEQYIALDYKLDVAYFIDVLMTPEQLTEFINRHPKSPKLDQIYYGLGLRYMRVNRLNDAREAFSHVRTKENSLEAYYKHGSRHKRDDGEVIVKEPTEADSEFDGVRSEWLLSDLKTIIHWSGFRRT